MHSSSFAHPFSWASPCISSSRLFYCCCCHSLFSLQAISSILMILGATCTLSSVQFSHSVMSNSMWPHGLQHARLPSPSPTPRACSNSCPPSRWCPPTISSSVVPFSSCLQSFLASGSIQMSQLFASCGQSTGVSASISVLPVNVQDWFPLGWTGWIFSNTSFQKHQFFSTQLSL